MAEQEKPAPRRRGRPRGTSDARERIRKAAADEFGEQEYDAVSLRGIARRAGVDPALVHHYFGSKADLFAEAIDAPLRPDLDVPRLLHDTDRDEVGDRAVRYILGQFEQPVVRQRAVVLLRTGLGNRDGTSMLAGFISRELLGKIAEELGTPDAELRASLAASQIMGLLVTRYVLELPGIATASVDELVERIGPTLQRYLAG